MQLLRMWIYLWFYFCVAIGITSCRLVYTTRSLMQSAFLERYCICVNILMLLLLPGYWYYARGLMDIVVEKPLLHFISYANVSLQFVVMLYTICVRRHKDRCYYAIVETLRVLDEEFFDRWNEGSKGKGGNNYKWALRIKFAILLYQQFMALGDLPSLSAKRHINGLDIFLNVYFLVMWNFLHSSALFYYMAALHICQRFAMLHRHLKQLLDLDQVRRQQLSAHQLDSRWQLDIQLLIQLRRLLDIHRRLRVALVKLTALFQMHLVAIIFVTFVGISCTFYLAFVVISTPVFSDVIIVAVYSLLGYFVLNADILLWSICGGQLVHEHGEFARVLAHWQGQLTFMPADAIVQRTVEMYCIHVEFAMDISLRLCGVLTLNKSTALLILQSTVTYTVILIQFDYLLRK